MGIDASLLITIALKVSIVSVASSGCGIAAALAFFPAFLERFAKAAFFDLFASSSAL